MFNTYKEVFIMKKWLFKPKEIELLKNVEGANNAELLSWRLPNFVFPILIIFVSIGCYIAFKPEDKFTWIGAFNILVNGSLPMLALNRISSLGINIIKGYNKEKEKNYEEDTLNMRIKIDEYAKYLIILIVALYIYQVTNGPFSLSVGFFIQITVSVLFISLSLILSRSAYLLQEKLLEKTFDQKVTEDVNKLKKAIK